MLIPVALLLSAPIWAFETSPEDWRGSVSVSPFHLLKREYPPGLVFQPFFEITGEGRLARQWGIAGILGGGVFRDVPTWEIGAQGRYYLFGSFRGGVDVGIEVRYLEGVVSSDWRGAPAYEGHVLVGPFTGAKIIADCGFTLEMQVCVQGDLGWADPPIIIVSAPVDLGEEWALRAGLRGPVYYFFRVVPLFNFTIGWSF